MSWMTYYGPGDNSRKSVGHYFYSVFVIIKPRVVWTCHLPCLPPTTSYYPLQITRERFPKTDSSSQMLSYLLFCWTRSKIKKLIGPQTDFFQGWPNFLQTLWTCANLQDWPSTSCVLYPNILWRQMMMILHFKAGNYGPRTFLANSNLLWHQTTRNSILQ